MPIPPPQAAKLVYTGPVLRGYQWEQELFDGSHTTFECIVRPDAVSILPFVDEETIILTKQLQPGKPPFFDLPGGRVDPGESAIEAARRELLEETGFQAEQVAHWTTSAHYGMYRFENSIFLASGLQEIKEGRHLDPGEDIEILRVSWQEAMAMCLRGEWRQPEIMLQILQMSYHEPTRERMISILRSGGAVFPAA